MSRKKKEVEPDIQNEIKNDSGASESLAEVSDEKGEFVNEYLIQVKFTIDDKGIHLGKVELPQVTEGEGQTLEFNAMVLMKATEVILKNRAKYLNKEETIQLGKSLNIVYSNMISEFFEGEDDGSQATLKAAVNVIDTIALLNNMKPEELGKIEPDAFWELIEGTASKRKEVAAIVEEASARKANIDSYPKGTEVGIFHTNESQDWNYSVYPTADSENILGTFITEVEARDFIVKYGWELVEVTGD